jgi:adenosylhomocysteine nucleosidase
VSWLIVAAEDREFTGIRKRCGDKFVLLANGPGRRLVQEILAEKRNVDGIVSTGFCGALDPTLKIGDIVVSGEPVRSRRAFVQGGVLTADRVAVTAAEKRELRARTGAIAVEMEASAVEAKAREWGVAYRCVKVVSDVAAEDMPLDFNLYRDAAGRFSLGRIAMAAMLHPFTAMPALIRLDKNCKAAAEKLGEFFADCEF